MNFKKLLSTIVIAGASLASANLVHAQADFKPSGNLWGYVFGDYYYKPHADSVGRGGGNVQYKGGNSIPNNAFQIRRAYLGYDYNITSKFSAYAVLANEQNVDAGGNNTVYVKYAYLKWSNIFKNSNLLIGQIATPSFATSMNTEPLWGYRAIERTIMDMHNNDGSSDLGISLQGKAWQQKNDSIHPTFVGYNVLIGNNASAKPETDMFKKFRGTLFVSTLKQALTVGVYADFNRTQLSPYHKETTTFKGYAHYNAKIVKVGVEYFQQTSMNGDVYTNSSATNKQYASTAQTGLSVFVTGNIIKEKLSFFARMDMYNGDNNYNSANTYSASAIGVKVPDPTDPTGVKTIFSSAATFDNQMFLSAGLDYSPMPRVHIMPNIWYNEYTNLNTNTSGKLKKDYDFVPRVTFYFLFNSSKTVSNNGMNN